MSDHSKISKKVSKRFKKVQNRVDQVVVRVNMQLAASHRKFEVSNSCHGGHAFASFCFLCHDFCNLGNFHSCNCFLAAIHYYHKKLVIVINFESLSQNSNKILLLEERVEIFDKFLPTSKRRTYNSWTYIVFLLKCDVIKCVS